LDAETEKFLYRRKADLESAARFLDNEGIGVSAILELVVTFFLKLPVFLLLS
jgi:hypothetical protein